MNRMAISDTTNIAVADTCRARNKFESSILDAFCSFF